MKWIAAVNKPNWVPTESSRICQKHFKNEDFSNQKKIRIKPDVVPSQNLFNRNPDRDASISKYMYNYTYIVMISII